MQHGKYKKVSEIRRGPEHLHLGLVNTVAEGQRGSAGHRCAGRGAEAHIEQESQRHPLPLFLRACPDLSGEGMECSTQGPEGSSRNR